MPPDLRAILAGCIGLASSGCCPFVIDCHQPHDVDWYEALHRLATVMAWAGLAIGWASSLILKSRIIRITKEPRKLEIKGSRTSFRVVALFFFLGWSLSIVGFVWMLLQSMNFVMDLSFKF
jgi:hypothetical protein